MSTMLLGTNVEMIDRNVEAANPMRDRGSGAFNTLSRDLSYDSMRAEKLEKEMSTRESLMLWFPGACYSVAISSGIIMEGYDNLLLAQFYAMPTFCKRFGSMAPSGRYEIPAAWQAGLSNGCLVGEIIGLHINAAIIEKYGYRKTLMASTIAIIAFISITFLSQNLAMLLVGEILCGIPWGIFQALTCAYASDVCPVKLRPYLTTYTNLCWVIGQFIGSGVLRGFIEREDQWSYRIPFALQWFWPIPIAFAILFAPESPWWLVRHTRMREAKASVARLTNLKNAPSTFSIDDTISMMYHTNLTEERKNSGTGYYDCFHGTNLRRTEISCVTWVIQNICGSAFMGYSTYFYIQAGLPTVMAFSMSLVQYGLGFIGTLCSWYLMSKFGRRTLFGSGLLMLFFILLGIGVTGVVESKATGWVIGSLLLLYTLIYNGSVGPITYSIVTEIPSTRLKNKTIVLARNFYNITGIINYIIVPYMLNPTAWNWGGKSGFFWAGICFICLIWTYFRLPEPKDRTFAEIDRLFQEKISARKFSSTPLDKG